MQCSTVSVEEVQKLLPVIAMALWMWLPGWRSLIVQLLCELLFCLELKATLRRISAFISSAPWSKKWNGKSWDSLNSSWEALALSKTSS